jgi:hypothetical protein
MEQLRGLNRESRISICKQIAERDLDGFVEMFVNLLERVEMLEDRVKELEAQLSQNSRNSSKPPSSKALTPSPASALTSPPHANVRSMSWTPFTKPSLVTLPFAQAAS